MYSSYNMNNYRYYPRRNDRFAGGFLTPFLLGGITGGLVAPLFYQRPYYNQPVVYPYSYYYGGYIR